MLDSLVHEAGENIQRSKTYYNLTKSEYRRGVKNSSDMLSATERFIMAKVSKMQIIRDFQLAKAHVLAKLGERHNNQR